MVGRWRGRWNGWQRGVTALVAFTFAAAGTACALIAGLTEPTNTGFDSGDSVSSGSGNACTATCGQDVWSMHVDPATFYPGRGVVIDDAGNVIFTGQSNGSLDLGNGCSWANDGGSGIFVAKLDSKGKCLWVKPLCADCSALSGNGIAVDGSGNVVIAGSFTGTINLCKGPVQGGGLDVFVAKFDSNDGGCAWGRTFGTENPNAQFGFGITVDMLGNVFVVGKFLDSIQFDEKDAGPSLSHQGNFDAFVVAFDPDGGHRWSKGFDASSNTAGTGIAVDRKRGEVLIVGTFGGDFDLSGDGGAHLVSNGNKDDIFVVKLDGGTGAHVWSKQFGDANDQVVRAIDIDGDGGVVFIGESKTGGALPFGMFGSLPGIFIAALDADGKPSWGHGFPSAAGLGNSAVVDHTGNVLITGSFDGTINLGGNPLSAADGGSVFVGQFSGKGEHQWSKSFGTNAKGRGIASIDACHFVIAGNGAADFGCDASQGGDTTIFLTKLTP